MEREKFSMHVVISMGIERNYYNRERQTNSNAGLIQGLFKPNTLLIKRWLNSTPVQTQRWSKQNTFLI